MGFKEAKQTKAKPASGGQEKGASKTFFDTSDAAPASGKGKAWTSEQAGVQTDESGRQYVVNHVGDRQYSDGALPTSTARHVQPAYADQNDCRPFGMGSRHPTAWALNSSVPSTHMRDARLKPSPEALEKKRSLWRDRMEWFGHTIIHGLEKITAIGAGRD